MDRKYFECYGCLEWLEPYDYYKEAWEYIGEAEGDDGSYAIVQKRQAEADAYVEYRYTII